MFDGLGRWRFKEGYISAATRGELGDYMSVGSENAMSTGLGFVRAFKGVTVVAGKSGSRVFFNTDQSYAGLGNFSTNGFGNVFRVKQLLMFVGGGVLAFEGSYIGSIAASSTLSYIKKSGGTYPSTPNPPRQAGHAEPSAPQAFVKQTGIGTNQVSMTGVTAFKIWRVSEADGQPSNASLPSNVITLSSQTAILQFPLPDTNGQTHWGWGAPRIGFADLGVFIQVPTSRGGEVAESTLSYTRTVTGASVPDTSNTITITDPDTADQFTAADVGRRISFGTFDSWITEVTDATHAKAYDTNSSGGTISGTATVTHAVEGITRAIEVSYTNGDLQGQPIVPVDAFPPPAFEFAGVMNDVLFGEGDGIIYCGVPGFIGSFPRKDFTLFPNEPAVAYLRGSDGVYWRFGKHSVGVLAYVGGLPALEYQVLWENVGIKYQQNAAIGGIGRLLLWSGKPTVISSEAGPDSEFANRVLPDFAGWEENQTTEQPVCPGYDGLGQYEVWCFQKKVMAFHVPSRTWCSPINLTGKIDGNIVGVFTHEKQLYLSVKETASLVLYKYDVGTGCVMKIQTSDYRGAGYGDTVSDVYVQGRIDNTSNNVKFEIIKNYADSSPIVVSNAQPPQTGLQHFKRARPNVINAKSHAIRITMTTTGGDAGVEYVETNGTSGGIII